MNKNKLNFLTQAYQNTFDFSKAGLSKPLNIRKWCEGLIEEDWALNAADVKLHRINFLKITGANHDDYSVIISQLNDLTYMHGIRHFNGNPKKPFIDLRLSDYSDLENKIKVLEPILVKQYEIFQPKSIRILLSPDSTNSFEVEHEISRKWLFASIKNIRERELPPNYNIVNLKQVKDGNYFPIYKELYKRFHETEPGMLDKVSVNNLKTMEQSREDGLLYEINVDNELAGYIAGERTKDFGESAIYFNEIVLNPNFKGKKYAAAAQRKFLELESINETLVWGTIDAQNLPSLKTALSVGRVVVHEEIFIPSL